MMQMQVELLHTFATMPCDSTYNPVLEGSQKHAVDCALKYLTLMPNDFFNRSYVSN